MTKETARMKSAYWTKDGIRLAVQSLLWVRVEGFVWELSCWERLNQKVSIATFNSFSGECSMYQFIRLKFMLLLPLQKFD